MSRPRVILTGLHLFALGAWAGMLMLVGAAAAIAFPTMKRLDPQLPEFSQYNEDHWMIAAGSVMNRVFQLADWVALGLATLALVSLVLIFAGRQSAPRLRRTVHGIVLLVAMTLLLIESFVLAPRMRSTLEEFLDAARAGDIATANLARDEFRADHPMASRLMMAQFSAVMLSFAAGAWCLLPSCGVVRGTEQEDAS